MSATATAESGERLRYGTYEELDGASAVLRGLLKQVAREAQLAERRLRRLGGAPVRDDGCEHDLRGGKLAARRERKQGRHRGGERVRPQHPEARDLHGEERELLADGAEERARAAVPREEGRRVLAAQRVRRVVRERLRKEAAVHVEQGWRPARRRTTSAALSMVNEETTD